jgi:death on curing protein
MITLGEVLEIHAVLIRNFGGSSGVRDKNLLESALNRPYATFGRDDLYPFAVDKAAAIFESIVINHPFIDGNKRTGYVLMRLLLMQEDKDINASQDEKYLFVIEVTEGKHTIDTIKRWITNHLI